RPRSAAGCRRERGGTRSHGGGPTDASAVVDALARTRVDPGPGFASGGTTRPGGPDAERLRLLLSTLGRALGTSGTATCLSRLRRSRPAARVHEGHRPVAVALGRVGRGRRPQGAPDEGADRVRAAAAGWRAGTASEARPRRAVRRGMDAATHPTAPRRGGAGVAHPSIRRGVAERGGRRFAGRR